MDDLVEVLIPERALDLACLEPRDAAHLVGRVSGQAAGKGSPGVHRDVHRVADTELTFHPTHPAGEQAPPLVGEGASSPGVDEDGPLAACRRGQPALARGEALGSGGEHGPDGLAGEEPQERPGPASGEECGHDTLGREPACGPHLGGHAARAVLGAGAAGDPLDLRRHPRHIAEQRGTGQGGVAVIEPLHVGEHHHSVGLDAPGHQGSQGVVVADLDLRRPPRCHSR